jgi:hypothetical protein
MKLSIDVKSAVLGGLVVALVVCSIGAVCHVPGEAYGRFQIFADSGHTFILDHSNGQVWSLQTVLPADTIRNPPHGEQAFYDPKVFPEPTTIDGTGLSL